MRFEELKFNFLKMLIDHTNMIVTGWASTGNTVTALLLTKILHKKFIYAGGMYKKIGTMLGFDISSDEFVSYEKEYGEQWDYLWENYIVWKLESEENILANAKVAGFLIDKYPNLFTSFIIASPEVRQKRAIGDNRTENVELRTEETNQRWNKLFGIRFSDVDSIRDTFDYVISNDNLSISQTAFSIYQAYKNTMRFGDIFTLKDFDIEVTKYNKYGKNYFYEYLDKQNLIISNKEIANNWLKSFRKLLENTKPEWQEAVKKIALQ